MSKRFVALGNVTKLIVMEAFIVLMLVFVTASSPFASADSSTTKAVANLQHTPSGTAKLEYFSDSHQLVVTVSLLGLAPNSVHPAHIHLGSCENPTPGTIKHKLSPVVANEKGQSSVTTTIANVAGIPATGWYINVHNGPALKPANQFDPISCTDIVNPSHSSSVLAFLGPSPDINESRSENATGFLTLTVQGNNLRIKGKVTGLFPGSQHAIHIHAGDCFFTQGVIYGLKPLVANSHGVAEEDYTIKGVSSIPRQGWAINVHYSTDLRTQTGYNVLLCGVVAPA